MVDAVSLSSAIHGRTTAVAGARPATAAAPNAVAQIAAAAPVSSASERVAEIGEFAFLYAADGRPEGMPAARSSGARLGVASGELDALLTSLMTRGTNEAGGAAPAPAGNRSLVEQLYSQF